MSDPTRAATPRLLYLRMQRGWIQRQFAERSGVDCATVQRFAAGALARMDTITKLAAALGVDPADLLRHPPAS